VHVVVSLLSVAKNATMTRDRKDATAQPNAMLHETRHAADGAWHDENESVPARTMSFMPADKAHGYLVKLRRLAPHARPHC
jgi:hypothetical protein